MGGSKVKRAPQVVIAPDLHSILKEAAFLSDVPIYRIVDALLRPTLLDEDKLREIVMRLKSK